MAWPKGKKRVIKKTGDVIKKRSKKVVKPKRVLVPKTRNGGTMTEAAFFGMIRQSLRKLSMRWIPISKCKELARRPNQSSNKRLRWEYQCNICFGWFSGKEVNVDHIVPCGSLNKFEDLSSFCSNLFCEVGNLQVVCSSCHDIKSKEDKKNMKSLRDNEKEVT